MMSKQVIASPQPVVLGQDAFGGGNEQMARKVLHGVLHEGVENGNGALGESLLAPHLLEPGTAPRILPTTFPLHLQQQQVFLARVTKREG